MNDQGPIQMTPQQRQAIAKAKARLRLQQQGQPAAPPAPANGARDLEAERASLIAGEDQRRQSQVEAVRAENYRSAPNPIIAAQRQSQVDAGNAFAESKKPYDMVGAVASDVGKFVKTSPLNAINAVVGAVEGTANIPSDLINSARLADARLEVTPEMAMRNANRMPMMQQRVGKAPTPAENVPMLPRADLSAARMQIAPEDQSITGMLAEGLGQFVAARVGIGKLAPGGGMTSQLGKDVAATGVAFAGGNGRVADMVDLNAVPEGTLRDYVRWLKTQPGDDPILGRIKNMSEDATLNMLLVGLGRTAKAGYNAATGKGAPLTPTNAGGAPNARPVAPPQAPAQPVAQAAPQPSVAPVVPPNVAQGAPRTAQAGPAGAGQQARPAVGGAGGAIPPNGGPPTLQATPRNVTPNISREEIAVARDTMKAVSRFMRGARIPGNVVRDYLSTLLGRYEPLKSERYSLAFFIEEDLPQYLQSRGYSPAQARNLAGDVVMKTEGWGRAAHSFNESGNSSRYTMQDTIHQLTTTQKAELEGTFKAVLGDETLAGKSDEIKALMRQNGQEAYTNSISEANRVWRAKTATPEQSGAVAEMVMLMKTPAYRDLVPESWAIEATTTGRTLDDVIDAKIADDPIGTAHWLQSEIGDVARGAKNIDGTPNKASNAYETRRKALLDRLEKFPGYKGARAQHGDLWGADESVEFGDDFLSVAKSEFKTEQKARRLEAMSPRQQQVAALSIRDALLNPLLRLSPEDAPAAIAALQKEGTLKALVTVLGPERGNELRNAIANMRVENQRIARVNQAAGPVTHLNQQGAKDAIDNIRGPGNRVAHVAGNPAGWGVAAGLSIATGSPIPLALKAAGSGFDAVTTPGRQFQSRVTKGLYGLREADEAAAALPAPDAPPAIAPPAPPAPPASGAPSAKVKGPTKPRAPKPPPTPEEWMQRIETDRNELQRLLRQYDQIDRTDPDVDDLMRANLDKQRNARRRIAEKTKKLEAARSGASPIAAPTAPATPAAPKGPPRPLPGQTSPSSPVIGGAAFGALTGAALDQEDPARGALLGGIGGGVVGSRFGKGAKPKAPPSAPRSGPPGVKPPPVKMGFGGKSPAGEQYGFKHLDAIKDRLAREQGRLGEAKTAKEREFRAVQVSQVEKELANEIKFLKSKGITPPDEMSIDDLAAELEGFDGAGMGGNSRGIADNLKQDAALAGFGSVGGSFANQDDPQAGALGGMGLALGGKYGPRAVNAMRGAGRVKPPPVRGAAQGKFRGPNNQTFAGVNAKTADKVALARAQNMEAEGAGREEIIDATGWFKQHGQWKFEIIDSGAKLTGNKSGPLGSVMEHPELYKAYPDLAELNTTRTPWKTGGDYIAPSVFNDEMIRVGNVGDDARSIALHEAGGHGVQRRENFPSGASSKLSVAEHRQALSDDLEDTKYWLERHRSEGATASEIRAAEDRVAQLEAQFDATRNLTPTQFYRNTAGEVEARNVQTRRDFTPEQRRARRPWETQDVPDDQQIVRFGSGKAESRPKPPPKGQTGNALAGKPPKGPPKKPAPPKKAEEVALINALKKARANETASRRRNVMRDNRDELNSVAEEAVMQAERDLLEYRDRQFRQAAEGARWMDRGAAVANVGKKAAVATGNQIKKTMMKNDAELLKTYGVAVGGIAGIALGARALAGPDDDDEKKKEVLPPTDKRYFVETKLKKRPEMLGPVQNALVELGMLDVIDADTKWGTKTRDAIEAYLSRKPDRLPNLPIQDYEVPALMAEAYGGYQENGKWFYNTGEPIVYPPRRNDTYLPARPLRPDEARRMAYDKRTEAERNNKVRP